MFNVYFSYVFTEDNGSVPEPAPNNLNFVGGLNNIIFEPDQIIKIIGKLKKDSSAGPDDIRPSLVEKLGHVLAHIFKFLFSSNCVPSIWKEAYATPIFRMVTVCCV